VRTGNPGPQGPLGTAKRSFSTANRQIQIFNLDLKTKIKSHTMAEDVVFWKWITDSLIGLVTETAVFHWNTEGGDAAIPVRMFARHASLAGCQIINYRVNSDQKWMVVVGISAQVRRRRTAETSTEIPTLT
jgi:clathrin heavy chain